MNAFHAYFEEVTELLKKQQVRRRRSKLPHGFAMKP